MTPTTPTDTIRFTFDNSYARELEGCYATWSPTTAPRPMLLCLNHDLARELRLDPDAFTHERSAAIFSGNEVPPGASPLAQAYAGHQFGGFSPQLGDGRALLLGEVIDQHGRRRDIAFKGSGRTPFSRGGDGKAALGPVLREYLIGEAMHALGIPTTRALAAVATGDRVVRERPLPGAVLTRVAASHLRVGTFEFFAARGQHDIVRRLADYAIARHYPGLIGHADRYLELLRAVTERQAALVAQWMLVGFIHGVMNTDNMTISGETIDYGPCAFMEGYDQRAVFSSIDHGGRYAYGNQPSIARWNLARFAETLLPIMNAPQSGDAVARATDVVGSFDDHYEAEWLRGVRGKLGLQGTEAADAALAADWLSLLQEQTVDWTLAWRRLADAAAGDPQGLESLFQDGRSLATWLVGWRQRSVRDSRSGGERAAAMRGVNPLYIPRNHQVEEALAAASDASDLGPFERLLNVLAQPFDERPGLEEYAVPAPAEVTARYQTFCGT
jgi:serine/tyrosine/threonine adenylyltransferase